MYTETRTVKLATSQMDIAPASVDVRLHRAEAIVAHAAENGAQLILLPAWFNTGYHLDESAYDIAEPHNGKTALWLAQTATKYGAYVAGAFLLRDDDDIYHSMVLCSPQGRFWRYDQTYAFGWERAVFREGQRPTIAGTALGKIGLMIGWDYAHPRLWKRYAGRIDLLLIASAMPRPDSLHIQLKDDEAYPLQSGRLLYHGVDAPFGGDMDRQAAWLGAPVVHSALSGEFTSAATGAALGLLPAAFIQPSLLLRVWDARKAQLTGGGIDGSRVINSDGAVIVQAENAGDDVVTATVELGDTPAPRHDQPQIPYTAWGYWFHDVLLVALLSFFYRRAYRQRYGEGFAPVDRATQIWRVLAVVVFVIGYLLGRLGG